MLTIQPKKFIRAVFALIDAVNRSNLLFCRIFLRKTVFFAFRLFRKVYNFSGLKRHFFEKYSKAIVSKTVGRFSEIALILGLLIGLWGGASLTQSHIVNQILHDALPEEYRKNGITIAAFNDWPPDEFVENGELKGWSIDMAKVMSQRLGVPFRFEATSFDVIIPGLISKRYDAGFSSFGVTLERLKVLDFIPQRMEGTGYAYLKNKNLILQGEQDLCGHSVALLTGAWDFQYLTQVSEKICVINDREPIILQQFTTQNAAELAVSSGRVEIVAAGSAKLAYLAKQTGTFEVARFISNAVHNGIGVRRGDPLGSVLRDVLQTIIDDGSYKQLMADWGVDGSGMLESAILLSKDDLTP